MRADLKQSRCNGGNSGYLVSNAHDRSLFPANENRIMATTRVMSIQTVLARKFHPPNLDRLAAEGTKLAASCP
jgi:hypothetical protein